MFDMETSVHQIDASVERQDQEAIAVPAGFAMRNGCEEPQQEGTCQTRERVSVYIKHKSVMLAAKECGITEGRMREVLTAERDRLKLTDIRYLYADHKSEFNVGGSEFNVGGEDVTAKGLLTLAESQSYKCALTGVEITPESSALDHIVPVSSGGSHELSNLQWVDMRVNAMKGELPIDEFINICQLVAEKFSVRE